MTEDQKLRWMVERRRCPPGGRRSLARGERGAGVSAHDSGRARRPPPGMKKTVNR